MEAFEIARKIVDTLEEKKGENIVLLDIREVASFADFFVICSGTSDRMLHSLADAVTSETKKELKYGGHTEGRPADGWLVIDLGDVVVHLFSPDQRKYYQLEELWAEGRVLLRVQ